MRRLSLLACWGCAFSLALVSCFSKSPNQGILRVQLPADPVSLDPALAEDGHSLRVLSNVMYGLYRYDGAGSLRPQIALGHELSPDGKTYRFALDPQAKWSDGKPVVAADFVLGMKRILNPQTGSKLAAHFKPVKDVREEEGKVVIELSRPLPYFLQLLTLPTANPSRQDILAAHQGHWTETAPSTGPYRIASYIPHQKIVLEKNPFYKSEIRIPKIEFLIIPEDNTGANLFDRDELDIMTRVPSMEIQKYRDLSVLRSSAFLATYYLSFNVRKAPFNDKVWRKAVSGSIKRAEIVSVLGTGETAASSWVPEGLEGAVPYKNLAPHFAEAIEAVKKIPHDKLPSISATFDSGSRNVTVMEKIQQDLQRSLGVKTSLSSLDWKSHVKFVETDAPQIYRGGLLAPFMDPIMHLRIFTSHDPNNPTGWSNLEYDRMVKEIESMRPGAQREEKIKKAQKILVEEEAIVVPIYFYVQNYAISKRIKGFRANPFGVILFDELDLIYAGH